MKRLLVPIGTLLFAGIMLAACNVNSVLTAADIGVQVAKAVSDARSQHPDDLQERVKFYAEFYCDIRDEHGFAWDDVYNAAIDRGAPESTLNSIKSIVDRTCPLTDGLSSG